MTKDIYRYGFPADVPVEEIEASLLLSVLATESLHGEAQVLQPPGGRAQGAVAQREFLRPEHARQRHDEHLRLGTGSAARVVLQRLQRLAARCDQEPAEQDER